MKNKKCKCKVCTDGVESVLQMQEQSLKKYGWYAHIVVDDDNMPMKFNFHTHHFSGNDVQIVLPMDPNICLQIMHGLHKKVKEGLIIKPFVEYDEIISNYKVLFIPATESNRKILRMILPDKEGKIKKEDMIDPMFAKQYEKTGVEYISN